MRAALVPAVVAIATMLSAAAPPLASHRAMYDVSLPAGSTTTEIAGVRGRMVMEFRDACDGFAETQRFIADMTDVDDNTQRTDYTASTWEAADGSKFDFDISNGVVGRGANRYQGHAARDRAVFNQPQGGALDLPSGTLFPAELTQHIIEAARGGVGTYSATVFQGDDATHLYTASVFIGGELSTPDAELPDAEAMKDVRSWPIVISYFPVGSGDETPEYEMSFRGYENGVATGLRMKYPNLTLEGRLVRLDMLPRTCAAPHAAAQP